MKEPSTSRGSRRRAAARLLMGTLVVMLALHLRTAGVLRGIAAGYVFHPDEPKQVLALSNYLNGSYLWYTRSWYYDGYPYGFWPAACAAAAEDVMFVAWTAANKRGSPVWMRSSRIHHGRCAAAYSRNVNKPG